MRERERENGGHVNTCYMTFSNNTLCILPISTNLSTLQVMVNSLRCAGPDSCVTVYSGKRHPFCTTNSWQNKHKNKHEKKSHSSNKTEKEDWSKMQVFISRKMKDSNSNSNCSPAELLQGYIQTAANYPRSSFLSGSCAEDEINRKRKSKTPFSSILFS